MSLQDDLGQVLDLQQYYAPERSSAMETRNLLVEDQIPSSLEAALAVDPFPIEEEFRYIYGGGGTGRHTKTPWVFLSDRRQTESAQEGWYLALLFSGEGSGLYLSLMASSTRSSPTGPWTADPRPDDEIESNRTWARELLEDSIGDSPTARPLVHEIDLEATTKTAVSYEKAHVVGFHYPRSDLPTDGELIADLETLGGMLVKIYSEIGSRTNLTGVSTTAVGSQAIRQVISDLVATALDAPPTAANRYDPLKDCLRRSFGLDQPEHVYVTYVSNAGNLTPRLTKQIAQLPPAQLAVVICGEEPNVESYENAAHSTLKIFGKSCEDLECVLYLCEQPSSEGLAASRTVPNWTVVDAYHRPRSRSAEWAGEIWPDAELHEVQVPAPRGYDAVSPSRLDPEEDETTSPAPQGTRLDAIVAADCIEDSGIVVDQDTVGQMVAAVNAGKHLLLQGPPGVGKTTIAEALAHAAEKCDMSRGAVVTTATGDWSSADTVGTYRLDPSDKDRLVFHPGLVLEAIDQSKWMVIDELNRADIDKAIGQLFTVLSGQAVTLPFTYKDDRRISIVPPAADTPPGTKPYPVSSGWKLIATMNERDRDLLFEMSEALVRRFAVVTIPTPDDDQWVQILEDRLPGHPELDGWLLRLGTSVEAGSPAVRIGPAIVLDCCDYLTERIGLEELEPPDGRPLMVEALDLFVIPHLSGHTYNADELRDKLHTDVLSVD